MSSFYRPPKNCQIPNLAGKWEALFGRRNSGCFVEVGAYDGESFSNTSCLADVGWSGLYIEPVPEFAERCRARHKNNAGVNVLVAAVSDQEGSAELFLGDTLTTLNQDRPGVYDRIGWARGIHTGASKTVRTSTLDTLLENCSVEARFDVLVVDVEGAEEKVLSGFDLSRWRPKVLVIELEDFHPDFQDNGEIVGSAQRVRERLLSAGYAEYYRDTINTIFIDTEAFDPIPRELEMEVESQVTIGLSVHDGSKTLRRTLDGILDQDCIHFDLVIFDNASTDETVKIIEDYSAKFKRLSVRRRAAKTPAIDSYLSLLDTCGTEFFVWIPDGGWWEPQFLGECLARLSQDPAIHLVLSDFRIYYHSLDAYSARFSQVSSDSNDRKLNFLIRFCDPAPYACYGVYRTDALKAVSEKLLDERDFSASLTLAIALRGKMAIVKRDLLRFGHQESTGGARRIGCLRLFKDACALAFRGFGAKAAILMIPQMALWIPVLWRRNQTIANAESGIDSTRLYRRHELVVAATAGLDVTEISEA